MTRFKPGDLAQVVPDGQLYDGALLPGDLVTIAGLVEYADGTDVLVTGALGEPDRDQPRGGTWLVDPSALRLVPADEQAAPPIPIRRAS